MTSKPQPNKPKQKAQANGKAPKGSQTSPGQRLPFEPKGQKKPAKAVKIQPSSPPPTPKASAAIPEVVSKRMVKRMAAFSGVPTLLGLATFPTCYLIITQGWFELPNVAVVLVSMGFLGLGVLGLSYGVLSASWDEELSGTKVGWQEFQVNFGRLTASWRSQGQKKSS